MGWLFYANTRKELVEDLTRERQHLKTVARATRGNRMWVVHELKNSGDRFIVLYLIKKLGGQWGFKDIDESMGPVELDCPDKLLDLVEGHEGSKWAMEWRARAREYNREQAAKLAENKEVLSSLRRGGQFSLYGKTYWVQDWDPAKKLLLATNKYGAWFRIRPSQLKDIKKPVDK